MTDIDPWEMDEDDPEAPWNKDPVAGMPETITPGRIKVQFWFCQWPSRSIRWRPGESTHPVR
jgi:hypothetical protein